MTKKIIYIIASRSWGGGEEYIYRIGNALRERGYEMAFVLQKKSNAALKERFSGIGEVKEIGVSNNLSKLSPLISAWRLYRFAKKQGATVIHVNAKLDYFVAVWAKIFSHKRLRIVATNHLVKRAKRSLYRLWIYSHIDALINVSECAKKEFFKIEGVRERFKNVYVIKNSVPDLPCEREEKEKRESKIKVLYHGRIHPEKGILDLIKHWDKVNATLYIAGTGNKIPETENVVNLGFCQNVREILRKFDISVAPSIVKESGGPLSVIEAMASGLPVVASDNGCQKEYVRDGVDGILCQAGNWDAFVTAINRLAEDAELRLRMGENSRHHYENELSFDKFINGIEMVYEKCQ